MKYKIRFKQNDSVAYPCAALLDINDSFTVCAVGKTWEEARAEVIGKARAAITAGTPPEPEEVEL